MHEYRQACLLAFTETWLDDNLHDSDLFIDGFGTPIRLDRNMTLGKKTEGEYASMSIGDDPEQSLFVTHFARLT